MGLSGRRKSHVLHAFVCCCGLLLILGCKGSPPAGSANSNGPATTIKLDGTVDKWLKKTPVWDNGPVPADISPRDIHIMKVFFDNDSHYFYAFIQCSPTVQDRYKVTQFSGAIGQLYFDADNNPETGGPSLMGDSNPKARGYKIKVYLPLGVFSGTSGGGAFASYEIYRFTGQNLDDNSGFNAKIPNSDQDDMHPNTLIADGKDGVEVAIPLEMLGMKPGAMARIMIQEATPDQPAGFTTYQCR